MLPSPFLYPPAFVLLSLSTLQKTARNKLNLTPNNIRSVLRFTLISNFLVRDINLDLHPVLCEANTEAVEETSNPLIKCFVCSDWVIFSKL